MLNDLYRMEKRSSQRLQHAAQLTFVNVTAMNAMYQYALEMVIIWKLSSQDVAAQYMNACMYLY